MANTRITQGVIKPNEDYDVRHINATGIITAQNISIGGTLTYNDVTSVDSIGIITARKGVVSSGVVTATAFHGDGSQLTGISVDATSLEGPGGSVVIQGYDTGAVHTGFSTMQNLRVTGIATFGTSSTVIHGDQNLINVGTALTLGHTQGVQFHTQNLHADGFEVNNINASGIITAAQFSGGGSDLTGLPVAIGTALGVPGSGLDAFFYVNKVLGVDSTVTVDPPSSSDRAYTHYTDIQVDNGGDLIIAEGDDLIPDVLGLANNGTFGGGASAGRLRVNIITDKNATGAPTVSNGLIISGVTTTSDVKVGTGATLNVYGGATFSGIVTASSFSGSAANLTNIPAGQLTGTIADERISASSVTQHVTSFDDNDITNDISVLALKVSALENSTASNTNSTFVDTYQDTAGVTALTNVSRTSGDFIASVYSITISYDFNVAGTHGQPELYGLNTRNAYNNSYSWTNDQVRSTDPGAPSTYGLTVTDFAFDLSGDFTHYTWWRSDTVGSLTSGYYPSASAVILPVTTITSGTAPTLNGSGIFTINSTTRAALQQNQNGAGAYSTYDTSVNNPLQNTFSSAVYSSLNIASIPNSHHSGNSAVTRDYSNNANAYGYHVSSYHNGNGGAGSDGIPYGMKWEYTRATNTMIMGYVKDATGTYKNDCKITIPNLPTSGRVILFGGNANGSDFFSLRNSSGVNSSGSFIESAANATGSYESVTINAASTTSKMGVVITYTDQAGTTTLNTDLKVFLSADNGTTFTQVTLVSQPNFATGIKMAKANDVTISNTGTQLKYKVEFANQSSGSKETRVNGVSLQY